MSTGMFQTPRERGNPRQHNRDFAAAALLGDIAIYCARVGIKETLLGRLIFRHGGFVGMVRKRMTVSPEAEAKVRQFMTDHPDGVEALPVPAQNLKPRLSTREAQRRLAEACGPDPCPACGHRRVSPCAYAACPLRRAA